MNAIFDYLIGAFALGMTLLYGATGEIITEKVGHLNLGIPGIMCVGGAGGCVALQAMCSAGNIPPVLIVVIAITVSFLAASLMGLIYSFLTVTLHANQNVTGLALTTFGVGTMEFIMFKITSPKYLNALKYFRYPFNASDNALKYCGSMFFLAIVIALVTSFVLMKTRVGLHLRAVGENPATADAVGINVVRYKYLGTCIGSGIAGLGGLYYIMDYSGSLESYLGIEALGWLAIALVISALWKPYMAIAFSVLFGLLFVAGAYIPTIFTKIQFGMNSTPLFKMLPYVVTIIILVITSIRDKKENQPPAALGINYYREDR